MKNAHSKPNLEIENEIIAKLKSNSPVQQNHASTIDHVDKVEKSCEFLIAGVDEVGRGCIAGPVVSAAVILPSNLNFQGAWLEINDSKKLSAKKRAELSAFIKENALCFAIAELPAETIDEINILRAALLSMENAIQKLQINGNTIRPDFILVDGNQKIKTNIPQQTVVKGDSKSLSIAAASIIAKVYRDNLMDEMDSVYPGYSFVKHKGYGTKTHLQAIKEIGPCKLHRMTFGGVKPTTDLITAEKTTKKSAKKIAKEDDDLKLF